MHQFQALVVGMGPVGLTAANLLGHAGIRTLVIERNNDLSTIPKALFIDDEFFRLLSAVGLGDAIREHGVFPVDFEYYSPLGFRVGHVIGRVTDHHFPNRTATFQPVFEKLLVDNLRRFPSVALAFGHQLTGLVEHHNHIDVEVRASGGTVTYPVDYVLGADGAHSTCRNLLGISYEEVVKYGDRHVVVDVANDADGSKVGLTRLGWRRNFMSLPVPGGGRRFEFSLAPSDDAEEILKDQTLERLFRPYRNYKELTVIRKVVYAFRARLANRLSKGRTFLLGDAAHIMPVFGSQGMNSGARDANNLVWKLAAVLQKAADPAILESYHNERHHHAAQSIRIAVANGKLQSVRTPAVAILRDLALLIVGLVPSLRRYIQEMRYIPRPVVRSPLVLGETRTQSYLGGLLPNPNVTDEFGHHCLLDNLIGLNFALIGIEVREPPRRSSQELWKDLRIAVISVKRTKLPDHDIAGAVNVTLADHRFDHIINAHEGKWLIVRPDRVVSAIVTASEVNGAMTLLAQRLTKTAARTGA